MLKKKLELEAGLGSMGWGRVAILEKLTKKGFVEKVALRPKGNREQAMQLHVSRKRFPGRGNHESKKQGGLYV